MKRIACLATMVLLLASATVSMAAPWDKERGMGPRWGMDDSILSKLDLTAEQEEQIGALRESFQQEISPLRAQIFEKGAELRLLWMQIELDPVKIKALEKEVHNLIGQLHEKSTDYRLALREILTPEQLSKFLALRERRPHHRHPWGRGGRGRDFGPPGPPPPPPRW